MDWKEPIESENLKLLKRILTIQSRNKENEWKQMFVFQNTHQKILKTKYCKMEC